MNHEFRLTARKIARRLELIAPLVYRGRQPLAPFRFLELPEEAAPTNHFTGAEIEDSNWPTIIPQTYWGRWRTNFILRAEFTVPADWDPGTPAALYLPIGEAGDFSHPESLAYVDGAPFAAVDRHHQEITLPPRWCDGLPHKLALYGWTGRGGATRGEPGTQLFMRQCGLVQIDQKLRDFIALARVALGSAEVLDPNDPAQALMLNALDHAFLLLDTREPLGRRFYDSVPAAAHALAEGLARSGEPLPVRIAATGHSHIDVAWLWTLAQARRKAGRTFHNVQRLMEQFPEYHFAQSQPQLYDYVREDYPSLFETIQERVREGRWEPLGGMWVEADCNVSGAESLARQFLLGRSFFGRHFGADAESPVLWLPDVFGFAGNLPQLARLAGMKYFFTVKLSWSRHNRMPYDSFWWQGLDGSRLLAHFGTTPEGSGSTYNSMASPAQVMDTWRNYQQKEGPHELLMAYGYGDGGGGPNREILENIRKMGAMPGMPAVCQDSVRDFFERLEMDSAGLPVWQGELYLEIHRGTYTTQSRNKRANRKSEFLMHDAEMLAAMAALSVNGYEYPAEILRRAWESVCLNQFHDIIPGSSIGEVYADSQAHYASVAEAATAVRDEALALLGATLGGDLLLANTTGFARRDLAFWPHPLPGGRRPVRPDGSPVGVQATADGVLLAAGEVPPHSVLPLAFEPGPQRPSPDASPVAAGPRLLENALLRVEFDAAGDITRIYDKAQRREVLPGGAIANQFQAFEDRPVDWDAWDVDVFYEDRQWTSGPADSVRVVESGPLRATLEVRRRIGWSDYVQRISLAYNSPRLDFETTIDWRERHTLLKVAFPVDVLASTATYEIQYGSVERATHRNTSWDWARFESCAQKWVDLSEGDYGVSLLNDCKYGHDIQGNVMRLSLLRSPTSPDPEADQGRHSFTYSLLPHAGRWNESTVAAAYALNDPLIVAAGPGGARLTAANGSFVAVDRPNVVIETVKAAEDGRGIIVRLYESQRQRGPAVLRTGFPLAGAWITDLLENDEEELACEGQAAAFQIKPFQIVTVRLIPG